MSTETSSRKRRANSRQLNKIFDECDRLSQPFNEDELRLALSEATECFKIQHQLDESYLETVQDDQYHTEFDLVQDKHTVVRKKLFQMGEVINKVELEKVAENVTMNTEYFFRRCNTTPAACCKATTNKATQIRWQIH